MTTCEAVPRSSQRGAASTFSLSDREEKMGSGERPRSMTERRKMRFIKAIKIAFGSLAALLAIAAAVIGFAHTKSGRPLLAWMGRHHLMPGAKCSRMTNLRTRC